MVTKWTLVLSNRPDFMDFIVAEIISLAELVGLGTEFFTPEVEKYARRNFRIDFTESKSITESKLRRLCSRSASVHGLYEVFESGSSYSELNDNLKMSNDENRKQYYPLSFAFAIEMNNRHKMTMPERLEKFESIQEGLPMTGSVNLKTPELQLVLIEDYPPATNNKKKKAEEMESVSLGRFMCAGQRRLIREYAVTNRLSVGNTSMDAELALWMSNISQIESGSFVFDPFVGSGSLLLTSAHYGSMCLGSDINYNVMMAQGKSARMGQGDRKPEETLRGSLAHFELENKYIGAAIIDNNVNPWRTCTTGWFDAVITDPPYGVREKCEKVGSHSGRDDWINFEMPEDHYPDKVSYELNDVFRDLLIFAQSHLRLKGRLVFWFPVARDELKEFGKKLYPRHSGFELKFDCEQTLNTRTSRILLVYEKISHEKDTHLTNDSEVHQLRNGFRELYFQPSKPGAEIRAQECKPKA